MDGCFDVAVGVIVDKEVVCVCLLRRSVNLPSISQECHLPLCYTNSPIRPLLPPWLLTAPWGVGIFSLSQ